MVSLAEATHKLLDPREKKLLPRAFDVIGDIAIFNDFPIALREKQRDIAHILLRIDKNIKVVAKKTGQRYGKFRKQRLQIMGGPKRTETIHKENGVQLKLDIEKCYFSPRLSNERLRIAKLVKPGEKILVMFSGVAPYPCVIGKMKPTTEIVGIEANTIAHRYAEENLKLNKLKNVKLFCGNVEDIMPKIKEKFDRIIMPLPKESKTFLDLAYKKAKEGTVIHLYVFGKEEELPQIKKNYGAIFSSVDIIKAGVYGPRTYRLCIDLKV